MKTKIIILALLGGLVGGGVVSYWAKPNAVVLPKTELSDQAFARVVAKREINCAYAIWAPYIMQDPNSKQLSGLAYDIIEQAGRILNVKINWHEEVGYSAVAENLRSGRNDVMCMTLWPSGNRAASLDFTKAVDYAPAYAYVRADDTRFDTDHAKLNTPETTVVVIDGDFTQAIPNENFPNAKQLALSQDSDGAQLLLSVTSHKADAVFIDPFAVNEFSKTNPGLLKKVQGMPPVRIFGDVFAVAKGETKLRDMLNVALEQMIQSGYIDATLDKYLSASKGDYFYPAKSYAR